MTVHALLVLDLFHDLVGVDGPSQASGYPDQAVRTGVLARASAAVEGARQAGDLVVWVTVGFSPRYLDCPVDSPLFGGAVGSGAFLAGTPGTAPLPGLGAAADEPVVVKPRVSPFYGTRLDVLLRTAGVRHVTLVGVATDHVVLAAARDAHDRDLGVTVLHDAVASHEPELHEAALRVMSSFTEQVGVQDYLGRRSETQAGTR